jgi:hypothetical protein
MDNTQAGPVPLQPGDRISIGFVIVKVLRGPPANPAAVHTHHKTPAFRKYQNPASTYPQAERLAPPFFPIVHPVNFNQVNFYEGVVHQNHNRRITVDFVQDNRRLPARIVFTRHNATWYNHLSDNYWVKL